MSAKVVLQVISGPIKGKVFQFDGHDTFIFGRSKVCHAKLPKDGYVSRHHFLLEVSPPAATIRDLGSLNGTHVNGVRFGGRKQAIGSTDGREQRGFETALRDRDVIMVGRTRIRVRVMTSQIGRSAKAGPPKSGPAIAAAGLYTPTATEGVDPPQVNDKEAASGGKGAARSLAVLQSSKGSPEVPSCNKSAEGDVGGVRALIRQAAKDFQSRQQIEVEGFELGEIIGQGGMGVVYKAVRKLDQFPVAIKVMIAKVAVHEKARQRFAREIEIVGRLRHANIVGQISSGSVGNAFYFVTEYCNGGCLAALASRQAGRISLQVMVPIVLQCLKGLAYAHQRGYVHRDIKPANILLHQQQRDWAAKLSDFGLAKQFERAGFSGMTLTGAFGGTYDYMPREQLVDFKNTRPVSDVWSMGATLYRLLTGVSPRPGAEGRDPMEVVLRDEHVPARQRDPALPLAVARVIDKSLAIDAADRYQDAGEMYTALKKALTEESC